MIFKNFTLKNVFLVFFYIIFITYSVETLLFFFLPNEQKNLININEKRIKIAKEKNLDFDSRHGVIAYLEESKKNKNLHIPFYFNRTDYQYNVSQERIKSGKFIPFRGPINKQTLSCNENLQYKLINNDKYGFKNPDKIFNQKIKIVLIGDSYAEGLCEDEKNDIAGHLRSKNYNSINLGVSGSGPLVSLAILREYLAEFKPSYVVYLYFEGNDLNDLNWEKKTYLINYLDEHFKIEYLKKRNQIVEFLDDYQNEINNNIKNLNLEIFTDIKKNKFFETLKDILEISNLKGIYRSTFSNEENKIDIDLFYEVIKAINHEVSRNGSNLIFVYLPTWSRYYTKFNKEKFLYDKKEPILKFVRKNNIDVIDFENILSNTQNLKNFFPLGYIGHYNSLGYEKLSDLVIKKIEN